jgi:hypothetical protein
MDWIYSTYGKMRRVQNLWSENLKGRDHLEDPGADERIILKRILRK